MSKTADHVPQSLTSPTLAAEKDGKRCCCEDGGACNWFGEDVLKRNGRCPLIISPEAGGTRCTQTGSSKRSERRCPAFAKWNGHWRCRQSRNQKMCGARTEVFEGRSCEEVASSKGVQVNQCVIFNKNPRLRNLRRPTFEVGVVTGVSESNQFTVERPGLAGTKDPKPRIPFRDLLCFAEGFCP